MTFIASVIAKEGVAIVADSFVTTVEQLLDQEDLLEYMAKKNNLGASISFKELFAQFKTKPSYTRNYMDKLFPFGKWSAITTSGQAYINKKIIKDLVKEIESTMNVDTPTYEAKTINQIIQEFCDHLKVEVIAHLVNISISGTSFIFSHFNRLTNKAQVFSIKITPKIKGIYPQTEDLVSYNEMSHLKIVTDGQDTFVDRLIFGSLYTKIVDVKSEFSDYVIKEVKPQKTKKAKIISDINNPDFLKSLILKDLFSVKFRDLSLQEAVDFASLLIRIVMDIQIYTEKIPTVGGLIRLAIISKDQEFKWVSGDKIVTPKIIL